MNSSPNEDYLSIQKRPVRREFGEYTLRFECA
jgi:hypothetical protein